MQALKEGTLKIEGAEMFNNSWIWPLSILFDIENNLLNGLLIH